ncbi:hypothetical protein INT45_011970 [Circinella minor]|uniref:Uncharacterized protein n=1 Tax=Circinella minor TaxID=1195481 RepID=A0A8H7VQT1_9FUNG|nr:hypothetical protein INT45_011970 [Circinella minor]
MPLNNTTAFVKRRFSDDDEEIKEEWPTYKRFNDNIVSSTVQSIISDKEDKELTLMPSITYASPDYRPPISPNALWLQPPAPQQQQQYNNKAQQQNHHQEKSHSSEQIMMVEETDSTDEEDLTTAVQIPSSILLDRQFKRSSTFEQNNWKSHGSLLVNHSTMTWQ